MKAARWHGRRDIRVEDVEPPVEPAPGNAIVRVRMASICASDLSEYRSGPHAIPLERPHPLTGRKAPLTLGHEYVGDVVAVAPDVAEVAAGQRVCGDACIRCGRCYWCLRGQYNICRTGASIGLHTDGAFAELVEVPAYSLVRVPDEVADWQAALTEPLAVGLHAVRRGGVAPGDSVVIAGMGMIGLASLLMARRSGAARVIVVEPNAHRRDLAMRLGSASAIDPAAAGDPLVKRMRAATDGIGPDVVLDCTGRQEFFGTLLDCARRGGTVVVAGLGDQKAAFDLNRVVQFERTVIGSLGYHYDHEPVLRMLAQGLQGIELLESAPIALDDIVALGFERMLSDPDVPVRIFVTSGFVPAGGSS